LDLNSTKLGNNASDRNDWWRKSWVI
jgi:hypothetical protein